jgi:hypothetical protein
MLSCDEQVSVGEVAGDAARTGNMRNTYQVFVGKYEGRRLLGRPGRILEGKIKMNAKELGCEDVGQDIYSSGGLM